MLPLVDACVFPAETSPPRERYAKYVVNIDELLARQSGIAAIRKNRGYWKLLLSQDEQARDDFSEVLHKEPLDALTLLWRAVAETRLGHIEAARQDFDLASKVAEESPKLAAAQTVRFWKIVASAYLDAPVSVEEQIESELKATKADLDKMLRTACLYAWCANAVRKNDQARSAACFDRSVALFREALAIAPDAFEKPRVKNELEGLLYEVPAFQELLRQHNRRYVLLQATSPNRVVFESHGLSPEGHLARCRALAAEQCRPVSMSTASMGGEQSLTTVSVWHRPTLTEERRDELAVRRAHAAIALLKLNEGSSVWPLFQAAADPRLRAFLIESVAEFGVEPRVLLARLNEESDGAARQAVVLALAEYTPASLGDSEHRRLLAELGERFRHDPDPGVHSAIGWLLEKSGQHSVVRQAQVELASPGPQPPRRWYVNGQGQSLAIVEGPVEFDMGSPYYETNKSFNEPLHRRRVGRTFAIATHEVTREQFTRFLDDHPNLRNAGRDGPPPSGRLSHLVRSGPILPLAVGARGPAGGPDVLSAGR